MIRGEPLQVLYFRVGLQRSRLKSWLPFLLLTATFLGIVLGAATGKWEALGTWTAIALTLLLALYVYPDHE